MLTKVANEVWRLHRDGPGHFRPLDCAQIGLFRPHKRQELPNVAK
jgi:hypothetical protein